ncbi:MAG: hypothetical protein R6U21_02430 [Thermoplasmatota archaeon]
MESNTIGVVIVCYNTPGIISEAVRSVCDYVDKICIVDNSDKDNDCFKECDKLSAKGDNSIIRSFSEIRNSVIMKDVNIGSNTAISHSVIGTGSSVDHGYSTLVGAAKKHCNEECISVKDIGVMIAEDSIIQPHVITHPGVIIGRYCQISPLKQIQYDIPSETRVM